MNFIGVTITDLTDYYKEMTIRSIKSFLKFHDTKLIVYIIGDKELEFNHQNLEIIHVPRITGSDTRISNPIYDKISDILINKLMCLTKHTNFIFFENDVFFLRNVNEIWNSLKDGITGTRVCMDSRRCKVGINTGLLCIKNYQLSYTLSDINEYFSTHKLWHPCDQFITSYAKNSINYHNTINLIVSNYARSTEVSIIDDVYAAHYVGRNKIYTDNYKSTVFLNLLKRKLDTITK